MTNLNITSYGGISTATVNGFASVSNYWPLALAGATLKYWRSLIAKRFHLRFLSFFIFALCALPSALRSQSVSEPAELTIAYSRTGIDTVFIKRGATFMLRSSKIDTMYSMRPASWIVPAIFGKQREHFYSRSYIDNLQERIDSYESGWLNGRLYLELTKAHDAKVDSLRKYIVNLNAMRMGEIIRLQEALANRRK